MTGRAKISGRILCGLVLLVGCQSAPSADRVLVDPDSSEFTLRLGEAVASVAEIERVIAQSAGSSLAPDPQQRVVCRQGNEGPKGSEDPWDSACFLQRQSVAMTKDPIKSLLAVDQTLRKHGFAGQWKGGPTGSTPIDVAAVRRGVFDPTEIDSASYAAGGTIVNLQVGRVGEPGEFTVHESLGTGYYDRVTGSGWGVLHAPPAPLAQSVLAVTATRREFVRTP